ncbi:MAG: hypothetical protein LUQ69_09690, partial [Methanoregulaceae archaeon]|nr:hypothetical protein [Methanoregulaceae archaeon]
MRTSGVKRKDILAYAMVICLAVSALLVISFDAPEMRAAESAGRDSGGYYYMDNKNPEPKVEYNWIDTTSTGTNLYISGSGANAYISLPFSFPLYGGSYTNLYVYSYGYVCFDYPTFTTSYSSGMPQSGSPNPMIAALWGVGYGNAYYLLSPAGAEIKWIAIEWSSNYAHNFELIMYESGMIKMQYKSFGSNYPNG